METTTRPHAAHLRCRSEWHGEDGTLPPWVYDLIAAVELHMQGHAQPIGQLFQAYQFVPRVVRHQADEIAGNREATRTARIASIEVGTKVRARGGWNAGHVGTVVALAAETTTYEEHTFEGWDMFVGFKNGIEPPEYSAFSALDYDEVDLVDD